MTRKRNAPQAQGADNELDEVFDMGHDIAFWEAVKPFPHPLQAKKEPAAGRNSQPHPKERAGAVGKPIPSPGESAQPGKKPGKKLGKGL